MERPGPREHLVSMRSIGPVAAVLAIALAACARSGGALETAHPDVTPAAATAPRLPSASHDKPATGAFLPAAPLGTARTSHTATLLSDGRVLVVGGFGDDDDHASAEVWDPGTGTFSPTGPMGRSRYFHTATLVSDGRVLVTGGSDDDVALDTVEVWDPTTGTFSAMESMHAARTLHTATALTDGRVLIVGGFGGIRSAELWDPATGSFVPAGALAEGRAWHTATLLSDGTVLVAGGPALTEVWDPAMGAFDGAGSLHDPRWWGTATLLPDRRVLVVGGGDGAVFAIGPAPLASVETWDPSTREVTVAGSLAIARRHHTATPLPNGRVLIAGGTIASTGGLPDPTTSSELWTTDAPSPTAGAELTEPRGGHTATLLPDGRVLLVGGYGHGGTALSSVEIWEP